jgi:hypothetical protein
LEEQQQITSTGNMTQEQDPKAEQDWRQKAKRKLQSVTGNVVEILEIIKEPFDIKAKLEFIKKASSGLIDHIIALIVIFVVNTIFLPILFLWGFLRLGRLFISRGFGMASEEWFLSKIGEKSK